MHHGLLRLKQIICFKICKKGKNKLKNKLAAKSNNGNLSVKI